MTLTNFDDDLDLAGVSRMVVTTPRVVEEVTITHRPSEGRTHIAEGDEWTWEGLRDYVVHQIEQRFGMFPRNFKTEHSIWKGFVSRWGGTGARQIATYAFEVLDGRWNGAPISVNRFCKNSDPFFAGPIAERLLGE